MTAEEIIEKFQLEPLNIEGGYFRRLYTHPQTITIDGRRRPLATSIYYLVTKSSFSALHRLKSDEIFHFYAGDPVEMLQLTEVGEGLRIVMGSNFALNHEAQVIVPSGTWQGTRLINGGQWALLGTTVHPGFDDADFELARQDELLARYPAFEREIRNFLKAEK